MGKIHRGNGIWRVRDILLVDIVASCCESEQTKQYLIRSDNHLRRQTVTETKRFLIETCHASTQ